MKKTKSRKFLLANPPFERFYARTVIKGVAPSTVPLSLACLGASLLKAGHQVKTFDFNLHSEDVFTAVMRDFMPDFVGITFVTPLIREADRISKLAKVINPKAVLVGGGSHCSSFPESSLRETALDIAVMGEGDFIIGDIADGVPLQNISGIAFKQDAKTVIINDRREFIKNLDTLPFPAYELFEFKKYQVSMAVARRKPVAWVETSRGCVYNCTYCNKSTFGRTFRVKSPSRVVEEFIRAREMGFKEIFLADDGFTTNIQRAKDICDLLIEKHAGIPWSTLNGIRADRTDAELMKKMKLAGCYRIYIGVESGSQRVLNRIKKGITLKQVRDTVRWAKAANLETVGYFMFGLPGDNEMTMQKTIDFARELDLDLVKAGITIPLPDTTMFRELDAAGKIKTRDWEKYKFHSVPSVIYDHETLPWPVIMKYYRKFYRRIYLNPVFIIKKIVLSIKRRTLIESLKLALSINWFHIK